jgi:hypothetical protein
MFLVLLLGKNHSILFSQHANARAHRGSSIVAVWVDGTGDIQPALMWKQLSLFQLVLWCRVLTVCLVTTCYYLFHKTLSFTWLIAKLTRSFIHSFIHDHKEKCKVGKGKTSPKGRHQNWEKLDHWGCQKEDPQGKRRAGPCFLWKRKRLPPPCFLKSQQKGPILRSHVR